jgi:integrase
MPAAPKLALVTPAQQSPVAQPKAPELTKAIIESAPPGTRLPHRRRMYLNVSLTGERSWRWAYRLFDPARGQDCQYQVKLGVWPAMGITAAEAAQAKAWAEYVALGNHPPQYRLVKAAEKKAKAKEAQAETVWQMVEAWIKENRGEWVASYASQIAVYMERYFGPTQEVGRVPFAKVTRNELVTQLKGIREGSLKAWDDKAGKYAPMARGTPSVAKLAKVWLNAAFEQACDEGLLTVNPIANLRNRKKKKSEAATVNSPVMTPEVLAKLLIDIREYGGDRRTKLMLLLLAHTCVRSSELRCANWSEFDLEGALWVIPAARMKMRKVHKVPLSPQAVALLKQLQEVTGNKGLLFPNANDLKVPMPQSSAREAMYRLTDRAYSPHCFRSTFSTLANEAEVADPHVIDAVLAHRKESGTAEMSYNQATYLAGRKRLMPQWSSYLEALVTGPALP